MQNKFFSLYLQSRNASFGCREGRLEASFADGETYCGNSSVGRAQPCQGWGREFESRFPLRASLKGEAKSSKKPYVSMICKVFSFFSDVFESIKKQVARTEIVTCFARTENRSRITHNALSCIVLRRNISMLHTFNLFKPMQPCAERHFPWFSSAKRPKFPRRAKHPSMPV